MEMRVPPNNVAAVAIIIRTLAVGSGVMAATVAAQKTYVAYIILCGIAITGFLASLWLPQPGQHLDSVQKDEKTNTVKIIDKTTNEPSLPSSMIQVQLSQRDQDVQLMRPSDFCLHAMSHKLSYTEKNLYVQRDGLTRPILDPKFYLEIIDDEKFSVLHMTA